VPSRHPTVKRRQASIRRTLANKERIASAEFQLSAFGMGCPPTKYFIPSNGRLGAVGAEATPSKLKSPGNVDRKTLQHGRARLYQWPPRVSRKSTQIKCNLAAMQHRASTRTLRCMTAGISIAASVS